MADARRLGGPGFEIVTVRYERWPRADDHRSTFLGVSWYSNTLRFELICTHRPPAHFALVLRTRTAAETAKWLKEHQAVHPPGLRGHDRPHRRRSRAGHDGRTY